LFAPQAGDSGLAWVWGTGQDCQLMNPLTPTRFWQQVLKSLSRLAVEGAMLQGSIERLLAQKKETTSSKR
jgi:hypothetical protein